MIPMVIGADADEHKRGSELIPSQRAIGKQHQTLLQRLVRLQSTDDRLAVLSGPAGAMICNSCESARTLETTEQRDRLALWQCRSATLVLKRGPNCRGMPLRW